MGVSDELKAHVGGSVDPVPIDRVDRVRWVDLCICGHLVTAHSPSVGGTHRVDDPFVHDVNPPVRITQAMFGCDGAMRHHSVEHFTDSYTPGVDGQPGDIVRRINVTCPCEEFRPVASVDRPHRYFNQRRPADVTDESKHPFVVGMRAYRRRIAKLKKAMADPTDRWADAEFDRRFTWLKTRVCGISACKETDDVWPVFVTDTGDGRSELRCAKHR